MGLLEPSGMTDCWASYSGDGTQRGIRSIRFLFPCIFPSGKIGYSCWGAAQIGKHAPGLHNRRKQVPDGARSVSHCLALQWAIVQPSLESLFVLEWLLSDCFHQRLHMVCQTTHTLPPELPPGLLGESLLARVMPVVLRGQMEHWHEFVLGSSRPEVRCQKSVTVTLQCVEWKANSILILMNAWVWNVAVYL